eukprot:GHVR01126414.1.p1 GENE.GHVR01126414.1~~GHVR01126414.1.p1  ORF type:complete len:116 (-),score=24.82 GHVR01126414.1:468-815(-)
MMLVQISKVRFLIDLLTLEMAKIRTNRDCPNCMADANHTCPNFINDTNDVGINFLDDNEMNEVLNELKTLKISNLKISKENEVLTEKLKFQKNIQNYSDDDKVVIIDWMKNYLKN